MSNTVFSKEQIGKAAAELRITSLENATIGEVSLLATTLTRETGIPFIRMDQGVPGLAPCKIGLEAEKKALDSGVAAIYPAAEGIPDLKFEGSRFVKAFLDVDIAPAGCVPVAGSVSGTFGSFIACSQRDPEKDTVLFIDPGFPINKSQLKILGVKYKYFDIHGHRGPKLEAKLKEYLSKGNITAIVYSNPNNPAWICLNEEELEIVGKLATTYDAIVLEDLAYLAMDYRTDMGRPFQPPYVPTVAKYTGNYILLLSSSKIFSYAGQRAALICISDTLFNRRFEALAERYSGAGVLGPTLIASILYMITSGITHTTQFGYAAMLKAASDGEINFVADTSEYARRARRMKDIFEKHGFHVVYDKDIDRPISDGFFFTIGYDGMSGGELLKKLLYYGVSSISLATTGSEQQGIRACCSRMDENLYEILDQRLAAFARDHSK